MRQKGGQKGHHGTTTTPITASAGRRSSRVCTIKARHSLQTINESVLIRNALLINHQSPQRLRVRECGIQQLPHFLQINEAEVRHCHAKPIKVDRMPIFASFGY